MTPDIMSASLRMHPCETERHVKDEVLCSDGLDKYDKEGFLDLLTRVNCHSIPKHDEVRLASHIRSLSKSTNMLSMR